MKFSIETATNCDSNSAMFKNESVKTMVRQQGFQAGKVIVSTLFCCCCCVDCPTSSLLLQHIGKLGIPPNQLTPPSSNEDTEHFVISHIDNDIKTPLLFTADPTVARALLQELFDVYVTSNHLDAFQPGKLDDLDSKAKVWHQLFGLPAVSKGTQSFHFKAAFARSGQSLDVFSQTVNLTYEVRSLAQPNNQSLVIAPINRV